MSIVAKYSLNGNADAQVGTNGSASSVSWVGGFGGGGGNFNGSSSKIDISNSGFGITGDFTLSALVRCTALNSEANVIGKDGPAFGRDFQFRFNSNGTITFFRGDTANGGYCDFSTSESFNDGKTKLVTASFSTSTGSHIAVDGIVKATNGVTNGKSFSSSNCQIGARGDSLNYFTGFVDEVTFFDNYTPPAVSKNLSAYYKGFF